MTDADTYEQHIATIAKAWRVEAEARRVMTEARAAHDDALLVAECAESELRKFNRDQIAQQLEDETVNA